MISIDNFKNIDDTIGIINSNDCLSFYMPDLNDFKQQQQQQIQQLNQNDTNDNDQQQNLKKQQEKFNILKEILTSEKKYLNDLKEIVEVII